METLMTNVIEYSRQDNLSVLSDLHKDVYGYRPRGTYSDYSDTEIEEEFEFLQEQLEAQMEREAQREKEDVKKFKTTVTKVMKYCNVDRKTALRYLADAEDNDLGSAMDIEGFLWGHGILHTEYGAEIKGIMIEIAKERYGVK